MSNLAVSVANKTILDTLHTRLPEAEIVRLDELYPDSKIDVEAEQGRLLRENVIVLQSPVFWHSAPLPNLSSSRMPHRWSMRNVLSD